MGITTKRGDDGKTGMYRGPDIAKDDPRIEFNGVLDELSSFLGLALSCIKQKKMKEELVSIREDLFVIGTEVVTKARFLGVLKRRIVSEDVSLLEKKIVEFEDKIKEKIPCFFVSDQGALAGLLNVARSIARKLERRAVTLSRKKMLNNKQILIYLNRLSDFLFLMAQYCKKGQNVF